MLSPIGSWIRINFLSWFAECFGDRAGTGKVYKGIEVVS